MGKSNKKHKVKATVQKKHIVINHLKPLPKLEKNNLDQNLETKTENKKTENPEKDLSKLKLLTIKIKNYFFEKKDNLTTWYTSLTLKEKIFRLIIFLVLIITGIIVLSLWVTGKF